MRIGFSLKEAGAILGVHERRVTQALDPSLERLARLWRVDPTRTMQLILDAVDRLDPMTDAELNMRELMQRNQLDRSHIHPR